MGVYWIHPDACPFVCRQGFWIKKQTKWISAQFISCLAFTLMGRVSLPLFIFVLLVSVSALGRQNIWQKWGFHNFLRILLVQFISNLWMIQTVLQQMVVYNWNINSKHCNIMSNKLHHWRIKFLHRQMPIPECLKNAISSLESPWISFLKKCGNLGLSLLLVGLLLQYVTLFQSGN